MGPRFSSNFKLESKSSAKNMVPQASDTSAAIRFHIVSSSHTSYDD